MRVDNPHITILIPTYKRAKLLDHVLDGLTNQTYGDFEVLVVAKPSGDGTEQIVNKYSGKLKIRLILQPQGYMIDALNLGLQNAHGKIIVFLDDDTIPFPNLVQAHSESYSLPNVGSVSGDVLKASLDDKELTEFKSKPSDLIPDRNRLSFTTKLGMKLWNKPLEGQENYLFYISKAGLTHMNGHVTNAAKHRIVKSLLARGANMSVLSSAIGDFRFPTSWIQGFTFEQYLSWHIWKKGFTQIFNPDIKVYHLEHGQSLSRNFNDAKSQTLLGTEQKLLYYRLFGMEQSLSVMQRVVWLIFESIIDVKRVCVNKDLNKISGLKSTFYSVVIGFKMVLRKKLCLSYSPLADLEKLRRSV
jgi:glycosyltransferase involved in cell wall biosynthesis